MSVNILNGILNGQLTTEEVIKWLTTDNPQDLLLPDLVQTESTRVEFVLFFLDHLRKQCPGFIQNGLAEGEAAPQAKSAPGTPKKRPEVKRTNLLTPSNAPSQPITQSTTASPKSPAQGSTEKCSPSLPIPLQSTPLRNPQSSNISFDSPLATHNANNSLLDASINSTTSNAFSPALPIFPVSPLYSGPPKPSGNLLNNSLDHDHHFPSIGERPRNQRSNKDNLNTSYPPKAPTQKKKSSGKKHNSQKHVEISLSDFFVPKQLGSKPTNQKKQSKTSANNTSAENVETGTDQKKREQKSRRRINPTKLEMNEEKGNNQNEVFGVISRPATKNPQFLEAQTTDKAEEVTTFEAERELLKLERQRQPKIDTGGIASGPEQKGSKADVPSSISAMLPKLSLVDNIPALDKFVDLYGNLIERNLVPNMMTELYFIMTIITSPFKASEQISLEVLKESMGCMDIDKTIDGEEVQPERKHLDTPHNCIYFATNVLNNQKHLLAVLDRVTIKLLSDNHNIAEFKPELKDYLTELYDGKVQQCNQFKENDLRTLSANVCFEKDTDNRDNFLTAISFSKFRAQRDLFYEVLKLWEDSHQSPNWDFSFALKQKINTLLSLHDDTLNYYHLARLFKSQLLASCLQLSPEDTVDDDTLVLLKSLQSLKSLNLEKFKQLQGRLVTPLSSEGPVPLPSFPGVQEFYHNFLLASNNVKFNLILQNYFVQEIIELNATSFTASDLDAITINVNEATKQSYLLCISTLRILAKFLGFLISIPFQSHSTSMVAMNTQISLRKQVNPTLALQDILFEALINQTLTLTVPWMAEYLSVLDPVAFRLPYYKKLCQVLYYIYRSAQSLITPEGSILITFVLGRLFELPNFPRDLYCTWQSSFNAEVMKSRIALHSDSSNWAEDSVVAVNSKKFNVALDKLNLVDERSVITCCPFLKEFKILLISGNCNIGSLNRHITPVSTQLSQPYSEGKAKTLELQQEDAFFHGQSDSMKRTVDFVAERVASNFVKYICRDLIPSIKVKHFTALKKKRAADCDASKSKKNQTSVQLLESQNSLISSINKELRDYCKESIPRVCKSKCTEALVPLLSDDTHPAVREMSTKICMRLSMERIDQWLDFYVNVAVNSKDIITECRLFTPKEETVDVKERLHNPLALSATQVIEMMRNSMWELIEKNGRWSILTEENILKILGEMGKTLMERVDLPSSVESMIYVLSVDYAIHLIVYSDQLFTDRVLEGFVEVWKKREEREGENKLFGGILSPRNIQWLRGTRYSKCWIAFGKLINRVMKAKLLGMDNFGEQCLAMFRKDLPQDVTSFLPECIDQATDGVWGHNEELEKVRLMTKWIGDACGEFEENSEKNNRTNCRV